jgi:outer membrane protein OmpA-like peptidoglycan-associated protein
MRIVLLCIFGLYSCVIQAQNFRIQIAAFSDTVSNSYFTDRGVEGVTIVRSSGGLWKYMLDGYKTRLEAEDIQSQLRDRGFSNPVIIDNEVEKVLSEGNCAYNSGRVKPVDDESVPNPVRSVYFEDGKSNFDNETLTKLDKIYNLLKTDPKKELRIMGFTDNKGSAEDNNVLAAERAKNVRNYFINKGIKAIRLFVEVYGEADPLFPNKDLNGKEIPENQHWNNRVMMKYK